MYILSSINSEEFDIIIRYVYHSKAKVCVMEITDDNVPCAIVQCSTSPNVI